MRIYIRSDDNIGYSGYVCQSKKTKIEKMGFPYLNMNNIHEMYVHLNGSGNGFSAFEEKARKIADKGRSFLFKDEEKLFALFQERFAEYFEKRQITSFGHLMQYFS